MGVVVALTGLIKKLKRQQHPGSGEGWRVGLGVSEPTQAQVGEPLGQFEAACTRQFELLAVAGGGKAEAGRAVPKHTECVVDGQLRQSLEWIDAIQWQGQAQQPVVVLAFKPAPLGGGNQVAETQISRHLLRRWPEVLLKCMGPPPG